MTQGLVSGRSCGGSVGWVPFSRILSGPRSASPYTPPQPARASSARAWLVATRGKVAQSLCFFCPHVCTLIFVNVYECKRSPACISGADVIVTVASYKGGWERPRRPSTSPHTCKLSRRRFFWTAMIPAMRRCGASVARVFRSRSPMGASCSSFAQLRTHGDRHRPAAKANRSPSARRRVATCWSFRQSRQASIRTAWCSPYNSCKRSEPIDKKCF